MSFLCWLQPRSWRVAKQKVGPLSFSLLSSLASFVSFISAFLSFLGFQSGGRTVLYRSVHRNCFDERIVRRIVSITGDVNQENGEGATCGATALYCAAYSGNIVALSLLLE